MLPNFDYQILNLFIATKVKFLRWLSLGLLFFTSAGFAHNPDIFVQERASFQEALVQLQAGDLQTFTELRQALHTYPLHPYLEFETINLRTRKLPMQEVQGFLDRYESTPIATKMRVALLNKLVKQNKWSEFVKYWDPSIRDARLNCWYLRSLYRSGNKKEALSAVKPLWLKANSQPKACDPLFKEWIEEGYLEPSTAWARLELAMDARRIRLARYLVRKLLNDEYAELGQEYIRAHRQPAKVKQSVLLKYHDKHADKVKRIAAHAVKRLARKNVESAKSTWLTLSSVMAFSEEVSEEVELALAFGAAIQHVGSIDASQLDTFAEAPPKALEQRIRTALKESDWASVFYLIQSMPEDKRNSSRWQYWLARSMEVQNIRENNLPRPKEIYQNLATERSYYGFLSADHLKLDYAMEDQPASIAAEDLSVLGKNEAIVRSLELYALGRVDDARREWRHAAGDIDSSLLLAAGKLAENFEWYEKAIRAYIKARYWDDLKSRFPLAYKSNIMSASKDRELDSSWVYAIARQESAFSTDARSHAGALGLMQLMPGTAKQTANQIGLRIKRRDLLLPETNIKLGSSYLKQLYDKFDGNRILATTAYNAGPHRVKKWLAQTKSNLPYDVWIETIPFKETRSYVQNVLAFSVIYDYRLEKKGRLITDNEAEQLL